MAAKLRNEFEYTSPIRADSCRHSEIESWMMQRLSIQRYLIPSFLVTVIASRYVLGSTETGISSSNVLRVASVAVDMVCYPNSGSESCTWCPAEAWW